MSLTEKEHLAREKICLALDGIRSMTDLAYTVSNLATYAGFFKVGLSSYMKFGHKCIDAVHKSGAKVFLDLKYHDIPNTVKEAAEAAAINGVEMFNVHASGGLDMMIAAVHGAQEALHKAIMPKIIGVTVLTSTDQRRLNEELRVPGSVEEQVLHFAKLSYDAGLDGIVCSAVDLLYIKERPNGFMYVTPGIRGVNDPLDDQKRTATPEEAIKNGSNLIVVGRPVMGKKTYEEKINAAYEILKEVERCV